MLTEPKLTIHASNDKFHVSSDMTESDQDGESVLFLTSHGNLRQTGSVWATSRGAQTAINRFRDRWRNGRREQVFTLTALDAMRKARAEP